MLRRIFTSLIVALCFWGSSQVPLLPPEFLDYTRQVQGDRIRFCVLQDSVLTTVNEDVARLLADTLLLESKIHRVNLPYHVQELGYRIPLSSEQMFYLLSNECDAFVGYLLSVGSFPEWQITTAPYLRTGFVLATREPESIDSFGQLPAGTRVGTQLGSAPNSRLTSLLRNHAGEAPWRRAPYPDNQLLLERLLDGSVDAALVWAPAVVAFGSAGLTVTDHLSPLPDMDASFAITLFSSNSFLQTTLDAAIRAVSEDGSLAELIAQHGVPGEAP